MVQGTGGNNDDDDPAPNSTYGHDETDDVAQGTTFCFEERVGAFPPLFLSEPQRRTASVNAGDYRLYVGGQAINCAFTDFLHCHQNIPYHPRFRHRNELVGYTKLHHIMLAASRQSARPW